MAGVWLCAHPRLAHPSEFVPLVLPWAPAASALARSHQQEDLALIKTGEMSFLTGFHAVLLLSALREALQGLGPFFLQTKRNTKSFFFLGVPPFTPFRD